MHPAYVAVIAIVAVVLGYVSGISYGREDEGDTWRRAVLGVPDEACRYAVREAMESGPFKRQSQP